MRSHLLWVLCGLALLGFAGVWLIRSAQQGHRQSIPRQRQGGCTHRRTAVSGKTASYIRLGRRSRRTRPPILRRRAKLSARGRRSRGPGQKWLSDASPSGTSPPTHGGQQIGSATRGFRGSALTDGGLNANGHPLRRR